MLLRLLAAPVTLPFSGFRFILTQVAEMAERELYDEDRIREDLLLLQVRLDEGEITEEEFMVLINVALYIGDPEGVRATDEGSHGLGSQRVTMLLRGYYNGVDTCGTFDDMLAPAR